MADKGALKTLHTRLIDSKDGYEQAAERVENSAHRSLFTDMIERRTRNAAQIRTYLAQNGIEMDDDGSILAAAHRTFLKMKDTVTGAGDEAILEEIIRGEETLLEAYDSAIAEASGHDAEYNFLTQQYSELKSKIEELRGRERLAA